MSADNARVAEARQLKVPWKKWGSYLSERQLGTVREDDSEAPISDHQQQLCFALALWNGVSRRSRWGAI
jgi:hypothetical protein